MPFLIFSFLVLTISLTGLKFAMHRFFDFQASKKVFIEYLIFNVVLSIIVLSTIVFIPENLLGIIFLVYISFVFTLEYLLFYKRHFDYESKKKYLMFLLASNIGSGMLFILVATLLYFAGILVGT
ncbi:MAG: hypothetical protein K8Q99_01070 [Acholeplasmataceae bacterium]|nr:hypothetical protein [Acholeplasmataceae bacterium]